MEVSNFSIAAVERETGLSKDVLRVWERRYGFPVPLRDAHGERMYPPEQVERLRLIKRLMDLGHRPGKLITADPQALQTQWAQERTQVSSATGSGDHGPGLEALLSLIQQRDLAGFEQALQQQLARLGLQHFVHDVVAPLTQRVGQAWEEGRLEVFEEHLFTELTKRALRQAVAGLPRSSGTPRVLLTSVPGEQHVLGLLMVEALLSLEGAECIPLGPQMPLAEIGRAAVAHRADVVALSFSSAYAPRQIPALLQQLRQMLPPQVALWAGGRGVKRVKPPADVTVLDGLVAGVDALARWRRIHIDAQSNDPGLPPPSR